MIRIVNWMFGALVPAFIACIAVLLTIDAAEAFESQGSVRTLCFCVLSLGAFSGLFAYLEWNRPKQQQKG